MATSMRVAVSSLGAVVRVTVLWGCTLAVVQLGLDLLCVALAGVVRGSDRGRDSGASSDGIRTLRSSIASGQTSTGEALVLLIKRLQGHSALHPYEYVEMGHGWCGYIIPLACWLHALRRLDIPLPERTVAAVALTACLVGLRTYPLMIVYTGGEGFTTVHGGGFNVYYTGECCGRRWNGERFFALDWHAEKLNERVNGVFLPRSEQRVVVWPHAHLCWRGQEFWPWSDEISPDVREAVTEARRQARRERNARRQADLIPRVLAQSELTAAVSAALSREGCIDEINRRFAEGEAVRLVGEWLASCVTAELKHQCDNADAAIDIHSAALRAAGRQYAAWKAEMRR